MLRYVAASLALVACATEPATNQSPDELSLAFHREHVSGDIYHYSLVVPVGSTPNAAIEIHRVARELSPYVPRPSAHAAMLLHGDFATFATSFLPAMAPYLAAQDIDVWGVDRRWTRATSDISDFGEMGIAQDLADTHTALALAETLRGGDRPALVGFSHGAELAYTYAATDGRAMDGLVALDFFGAYAPADAELKTMTCDNAAEEAQLVDAGTTDSPNDFFIAAGQLDASAPGDPSPLIDGMTNREVVLFVLGQTYQIAPITPTYQLLATTQDGRSFAQVTEAVADAWIADAPPHESMREAADFDATLCDGIALANIRQPLLYIGAADGVGAHGLYATHQVSSTDVTSFVVPGYGHGDLLFASDAARRVWRPLAAWLARH